MMQKDFTSMDKEGSTAANTFTSNPNLTVDSKDFNWEMTELLNHINVGFFSRDIIADKYIRLSEGCVKIYGYTLQDFYDNSYLWYEVILPEDSEIVAEETARLEKGNKCVSEYRICHKDGSIRWLEVKAIPILKDGLLVRVDGIVSDITDRKNFELEILEANRLSQIVMDSLPGIFYMYDEEGHFKCWNKNFSHVTGYTDHEIAALHPLDLFDIRDKILIKEAMEGVFKFGHSQIEAFLLTRAGEKIPHYFNGHRVTVNDKVFLVGVGIDSSKMRRAEEELRKSREMLTHVLNTIPQAIFWKDVNSVYRGCNTVFAQIAGLSQVSDIIGKTDFDLPWLPGESEKYVNDDIQIMQSETPKIHFIERQKLTEGNDLWSDITKIPLKNQNNEVEGILGIYEDITERKLEEEKQQKINEDLIQKNIGLRQFSYIVSHNLRSPIAKILGLASLFEHENDPALNQELVGYIANETLNLDNIVKDLNAIVGAQTLGNQILEEISFKEELRLILQSVENDVTESKATIKSDFSKAESVKSVRAYFYSILYNLISNAIKYRNPQHALVIQVESIREDQFICMSVKDNGLGIDLEKYGDKIFGLYNRFHTGVIPGKGIGLNLVKTQAETLGGKVELESKAGEGCLFKVYFPIN